MPVGHLEIEQYADLVPMRVAREEAGGTSAVTSMRMTLQTEFEYGVTDWLEFGWYFVFRQGESATTPALRFQGIKQRVRANLSHGRLWPVDVGIYLEVAEYYDEVEIEQKLILSKRLGALRLALNLWVEQEYYFQERAWKFIFNPTAGATYELNPHVSLGVEYWARGRFDSDQSQGGPADAHHYLGPTMLAQSGEYFLTVGAYARLDEFSRAAQVGDDAGKYYVRTMLGIGL